MRQPITGYHQDELGDWVAELACGHFQHVRHNPPWFSRPWVTTGDGRQGMLGTALECVKCDEGAPRDRIDTGVPFLTARWEHLVLCNFDCPRTLLEPLVPAGTELDSWHGADIVSLVGFRFVDTRVRGVPVPGHRNFEEVNLRFYVRRRVPGSADRRAVVFVRELVPRRAIAWVARRFYNEPYMAVPMAHRIALSATEGGEAEYSWTHAGQRHRLRARVSGPARRLDVGSEAEFITEHYWGCTTQRDGSTREYRVSHPPWTVWQTSDARYESPGSAALYGPGFTDVLAGVPRSVFVATGSEVTVFEGRPVL